MKRRFLAMLLSLVMVFAMLPVSAFAADVDTADDDADVDTVTTPVASDANENDTTDDDADDGKAADDPTGNADTTPSLEVTFYGDGEKGNTAISKDDCERDTMWVRATELESSKTYLMTIVAPDGKSFKQVADDDYVGDGYKEKLFGVASSKASAGVYFSLKRWDGSKAFGADIDGNDLSGTYTVKLYEGSVTTGQDNRDTYTYGTEVASETITIEQVTVDFGAAATGVTTTAKDLIYQHEDKQGNYFFTEGTGNATRTATFYADATDLTAGAKETDRDVLLRLISFKGTNAADNNQFKDENGKEWVYNATSKTFTYADVVTIKAAANDDNVEPPTETVLKKDGETFEVSVTANYLPKADNATFTLKTAGTTGDSAQKAVWTGTLKDAAQISGTEVSVSAVPAVSVKAATTGVSFPSDNVVTEQSATTQIAMFEITQADTDTDTKASVTITVTSDKQPEVTSPAGYGIFVADSTAEKTWKLVKEGAEATEITVGLKEELTAIAGLNATATRNTEGQSTTITLAVTKAVTNAEEEEEKVTSFKYKLSEEEAEKPEVGTKITEADYTDYNKTTGFDYEPGKDYVEVVTVNAYNEITAWGLAVIPKEKAEVVQAPSVTGETATANVDKKDVDTALEAAIQATPAQGETTTTAKLDFTTDANGDEVKADNAEITIPAESIDKIKAHNDQAESQDGVNPVVVEIATPAGDVTANEKVLEAIAGTKTGVSDDATNVESTKVVLTIEKTVETDDTTATTKSEAFEIKFEKVVTFNDGTTEDKHVPVKVESSVKVSVPTTLNPDSGKLFTYFKDTANKLFYAAMATVTGGRASFTAPHLSTYVMFEDEQTKGDIGVYQGSDPIIFDDQKEASVTANTITLKLTATDITNVAVAATDTSKAEYNATTGEFKLINSATSAKLIITRVSGANTETYTLTLNAPSAPTITVGTKSPVTLSKTGPNTITAEATDDIVISPVTGVTVTDASGNTIPVAATGVMTLGVGTHTLTVTVGSDTYTVTITRNAAAGALDVTASALQMVDSTTGAAKTTQNRLTVTNRGTNCEYVIRVQFKGMLPDEWFMFTSEDGEVIVPYDAAGYQVAVYEFAGVPVTITNGSPVGYTNRLPAKNVTAAAQ